VQSCTQIVEGTEVIRWKTTFVSGGQRWSERLL